MPKEGITYEELREYWDDIEKDPKMYQEDGLWPRGFGWFDPW